MRFVAFITLTLLLGATPLHACDRCACGAANYYLGIMPQFNRSFVGLRYRQSEYFTTGHYTATREHFQVAELWGRFYPHRKVQLLAFLPYQVNRQTGGPRGEYRMRGLGDAVFMANYNLLRAGSGAGERVVRHSLWLGGGLKAPTGRYQFDPSETNELANANFQLGTGSWDALLNGQYTLRLKRLGFSLDATYRLNGKNSREYRFGNRLGGTLAAFYVQQLRGAWAIMPSLGCHAEHARADQRYGRAVEYTGGHLLAAQAGLDVYFAQNYALSLGWQQPFDQRLSAGSSEARGRAIIGIMAMF